MATSVWLYLLFVMAALAADHRVFWRRFVARATVQPERARLALWKAWMGMLWVLALVAVGLWAGSGRSWGQLGLRLPTGWRLWAAVASVFVVVAMYASTLSRLSRLAGERMAAVRARFGSHADMLPHTRSELAWFIALSITAGICEELVFRGYLLRALQPVAGLWIAVALSCLIFALAHAYQGMDGVFSTGLIGAFFMAAVLTFDSLLPVMLAHVFIDIGQGAVAWMVLRERAAGEAGASSDEGVSVA